MKRAFVGSGEYNNKEFVLSILESIIDKENDVIVSGHSPRNPVYVDGVIIGYNNVDHWSEIWGNDKCINKPIIFPPKEHIDIYYKKRNKQIADTSYEIRAFIPTLRYISGTWNTIKHFVKRVIDSKDRVFIYNEYGILWKFEEYPLWLQNRMLKINRLNINRLF